ncbi:MAG: hypothetical protein JJ992_06675 [Planctomycetes bacterium]|nr:hypothetical protein [Planctomycetota bacterium]
MHNAFWISFWMVFMVPGGAFSAAATATERGVEHVGVMLAIWISAAAASVASVICATVLMVHSRSGRFGVVAGGTAKPMPKWTEH